MTPREVREEINHTWLIKKPKPQVSLRTLNICIYLIPLPFDTKKYCFIPHWNKTQKSMLMGVSPAASGGMDRHGFQTRHQTDISSAADGRARASKETSCPQCEINLLLGNGGTDLK